jgi:hypothetical protein
MTRAAPSRKGIDVNPIRLTILLALASLALAAPASAWPYIDVTASEVVSVDPPRYHTTFELSFVGYDPSYYGKKAFGLDPLDPLTLHLYECGAPPLWFCGPTPPAAAGGYGFSGYHGSGAPTQPVYAFSIVTDQVTPCVRFTFSSAVPEEPIYQVEACLIVDAPVPARPASWGSVKSLYR